MLFLLIGIVPAMYLAFAPVLPAKAPKRVQATQRSAAERPAAERPAAERAAAERPSAARESADPPGDTREGWSAAVARDPSPSLETPGEPMRFERRVALTFDDGPNPDVTPKILDTLREQDLKATFFVVGEKVAEHPDILRRIAQEGHTLGNHTYTHPDLSTLTYEQMQIELQATQEAVDRALGYHHPLTMMRPPFGEPYFANLGLVPQFEGAMREWGMYTVMWTTDSRDILNEEPELIVQTVKQAKVEMERKESDGVLLLHDTKPATAEALPMLIDFYRESNLEFSGVRELLAKKYGVEPNDIQEDPRRQPSGASRDAPSEQVVDVPATPTQYEYGSN